MKFNLILALITTICISSSCSNQSSETQSMESVTIQHIRNATLKMEYAGKTILIDPMLGEKESFMSFVESGKQSNPTVALSIPAEEVVNGIDMVFLTHPHIDHFDQKAAELLPKEIPFYIQPSDLNKIENSGFSQVTPIEDSLLIGEIKVHRTTGKHALTEQMANALGLVSGFVFQAEGYPTVYVIGDCVYDEIVKAQIDQFQPDIIITNSGGAILGGERILMDEAETVALIQANPSTKVVATHIEALDHCKVTRSSLQKAADSSQVKVTIPKDGEKFKL